MQYILANGKKESDMALANNIGILDVFMKANGKKMYSKA